jgi:gliding motility-associated-like protein
MATPANFDYVDSVYNWKSLVDYFCLNSYIVNKDWLNWNTSWWRGLDPNGDKKKWRYSLWDMDASFGHYVNFTGIPDPSANADPCNVEALPNPGGEGHTEIMVALMNNPTFEQYYISRYIDLGNTTFNCTNMIGVLDSLLNIITPEMNGQIGRWGGSMAQWQQNVQDMRDFINNRCVAISQGMIDCYEVTGPFPITVDVNPPGSGKVKINSVTPSSYAYSGDYYGNIDILLKANANNGYVFNNWEISNHTLDSSIYSYKNSLQITQPDYIIAHFVLTEDWVPPVDTVMSQVPMAFSPNGDGNNDILYVYGGPMISMSFDIYDRWGEKMFSSTSQDIGWDGNYNGRKASSGVYVYTLRAVFSDGETSNTKGTITLVR